MQTPVPDKARLVRSMFGRIAGHYDLMNTLMTAGLDAGWRKAVVRALDPPRDGFGLDVGTGTARLAALLSAEMPNGRVIGVDFAEPMLRRALRDLPGLQGGQRVTLVQGDALALPFSDCAFDRVATAFTVRNVVDVVAAFREIWRVLKPGGRVACLEITRPHPLVGPAFRLYFRHLVPVVGRLVAGDVAAYTYLPESAFAFLDAPGLAGAMRQAGLEDVRYRYLSMGAVALHLGSRS